MKKSDLISLVREVVQVTEKKKGVDGKACWKGYRYAGTKNGKDICIKVKGVKEETEADSKITLISVIDGKRNLNIEQLRQIFNGDVLGTFYIRTYEEDEYENEKPISKQEAFEYIKYYNSRIDGDSNTEERLGAKLGVLGIESELRFNHGEVKADPTVFSTNENYADGKEKEIVDDILSSLNEGSLDSVLNKMKQYAKKGLLTLAMVASVAQGLQAQGVDKNQADQIQQSGIELVQQTSKINKQVEKQNLDKVKKLLGGSFEKMNKLAQQTGTILVANKGTNLNLLKNMNQMNAKSHFNGSIEKASLQDQKVLKAKDGKYIVISFYQITVNEKYADGKVNEQEMSQDDFNTVGNVLRDSTKAKQIHSLLLQMFPQQKELLNYNYKNDSYAEFKRFIFHIDKYKLEGPVSINYTNLKLDPENMKARERKYQEYIDGKIDKYFRDTNSDPRKVDLSKMPPITVDETGEVMDGNHRAFLAIKQQKPLKGYKIVNTNNTHPNVAKILQIVGREVKENYADGKVKGKSRPGRVKKSGASCKGSVTDLRAKAKKYGGEKGKMYHWCANMKGGK